MGRRGEGGWTEIGPNRFRVSIVMPDGRRIWRRTTGVRNRDRALKDLRDAREQDLDPSALTLAEWLRSWLASEAKRGRIRPRTLDHYRLIVERHIIPTDAYTCVDCGRRLAGATYWPGLGWTCDLRVFPVTGSCCRPEPRTPLTLRVTESPVDAAGASDPR